MTTDLSTTHDAIADDMAPAVTDDSAAINDLAAALEGDLYLRGFDPNLITN
ncbi:hypothetical protein AB0B25_29650 [Nocardia sp. NPDC049190]|uniref:hypothetical protein n=1 Tax=Nocardia sp. NPDC049190 TaxID=3155650 RepID=UPI00340292D8